MSLCCAESEHSVVLKEITVPLWEHAACNSALQSQFGPAYRLPQSAVCAGAEGHDACDGDGGGPLVCEQDGQWYQVGVVRDTPATSMAESRNSDWYRASRPGQG